MNDFRPCIIPKIQNVDCVQMPAMISCKLSGCRTIIVNGKIYNKYMTEIKNKNILYGLRGLLKINSKLKDVIFDGVLYCKTVDKLIFYCSDLISLKSPDVEYEYRKLSLYNLFSDIEVPYFEIIFDHRRHVSNDINDLLGKAKLEGHDGVIIKSSFGIYKQGLNAIEDHTIYELNI